MLAALAAVALLAALGLAGSLAPALSLVVLPGLALAVFIGGMFVRAYRWSRAPVPFRIPVTCGQEKSLPWIARDRLDNPFTTPEVIGRLALEVFFFRSLLRNTSARLRDGRLSYARSPWLWAFSLLFHWSLLVVLVRHLRFFLEPVPAWIAAVQRIDGLPEGLPLGILVTDLGLLAGLSFLFLRRAISARLRYLSLPADYFALFLLLAIAGSGTIMRHLFPADLAAVKALALGWAALSPTIPSGIGFMFHVHLFLVCALLVYFPFSKLVHLGAIFLSPTRNLANNSRAHRHLNPWDYPVKTHTYAEWEREFHDVIAGAGLPLDKE